MARSPRASATAFDTRRSIGAQPPTQSWASTKKSRQGFKERSTRHGWYCACTFASARTYDVHGRRNLSNEIFSSAFILPDVARHFSGLHQTIRQIPRLSREVVNVIPPIPFAAIGARCRAGDPATVGENRLGGRLRPVRNARQSDRLRELEAWKSAKRVGPA